jgi:hypothetical protein
MGLSKVQDQRGGVRYHRRYLKPAPFVVAAFMTLAFGATIPIVHTGISTVAGLIAILTLLTLCYLDGPAKSVTVRNNTLEVRNSIHRYEIPPSRILSIDHMEDLGVRVRVQGDDKPIWVGAFSRTQIRFQSLSSYELRANAKSLTDALFATPAPVDQRQLKATYRWAHIFLIAVVCIALLVLMWVVNGPQDLGVTPPAVIVTRAGAARSPTRPEALRHYCRFIGCPRGRPAVRGIQHRINPDR